MMEKVENLLKDSFYVIPKLLINNLKKLDITEKQTILLIHILNSDKFFNPKQISQTLDWNLNDVLEEVNNLSTKGIIKIDMVKRNNMREEYLNLDLLYSKLAFLVVNDSEPESDSSNLFDIFEKEFGRTLSPMEYEIINSWKDSDMSDELIYCALKEAIFNGVSNLRYIDKILFEWKKKGYNSKSDVEKGRNSFKKKDRPNKEVFEYDWLNEND